MRFMEAYKRDGSVKTKTGILPESPSTSSLVISISGELARKASHRRDELTAQYCALLSTVPLISQTAQPIRIVVIQREYHIPRSKTGFLTNTANLVDSNTTLKLLLFQLLRG